MAPKDAVAPLRFAHHVSASAADRRGAPRILIHHEVDCKNENNFLLGVIGDISATGIFILTHTPEPVGTSLNLRFVMPSASDDSADDIADASDEALDLEGEVMWINPFRPGHPDSIHPGMGVRFVDLDRATERRLLRFIDRIAYLAPDGP